MWPRCTGCAACTPELDGEALARLQAHAAATVAAWARGQSLPAAPDDPALQLPAGVFVTLRRHGELRGCVGHIEDDGPLARRVSEMAVAAARDDPRFAPVKAAEVADLDVEVSVLTPPRPAAADEVVPGRHGVIVTRGRARGLLLPQVAGDQGFNREQLLQAACVKARLAPDAWRDPATTIEVFEARIAAGSRVP